MNPQTIAAILGGIMLGALVGAVLLIYARQGTRRIRTDRALVHTKPTALPSGHHPPPAVSDKTLAPSQAADDTVALEPRKDEP